MDQVREPAPPPSRLARMAARLDALNEYERTPVAPDRLKGGRHFAAIFGGEHVAGTEFVIGSTFVLWGVGARDLLLGLIAGNILAVLSWTLICAPIAVRTRLTLYWYLRRIAGPGFAAVYGIANALLFCFLAGAMIALSADAVATGLEEIGIPFVHPRLDDWSPRSAGWVALVLLCGGLTTTVAILGFEKMARFASACVPWMFLIFIAGALATLPKLGLQGPGDFWRVANERIWTGEAIPGLPQLGFWHVASFAWFCNLCTHVDLSDMALFRYAPHWGYGLYSGIGMFLGHFVAWICSGILCAPLRDAIIRDRGLPIGGMVYGAAGLAGLLCVLLASWTTANPTLYRAGLALQAATPGWPRWKVTLAAGTITSIAACSPWFVMRLLDFVALFGLVLMPVGAVVFSEHWLFPRLGLRRYWAERAGLAANPAAVAVWVLTLLFCLAYLWWHRGIDLFFLWLPGYAVALALYPALAWAWGAREAAGAAVEEMRAQPPPAPASPARPPAARDASRGRLPAWRLAMGAVAVASLAAILGAALARAAGAIGEEALGVAMTAGTVVWFATGTLWLTPGIFGIREEATRAGAAAPEMEVTR